MPSRRRIRRRLTPDLQISFWQRLEEIRTVYLDKALQLSVADLEVARLDRELNLIVGEKHLRKVAASGIRGEVFFPVPSLLRANPFLLGYYRLLYGFSGKAFYSQGPFGRFSALEERGMIPNRIEDDVEPLCRDLSEIGRKLVDGLGSLSPSLVHELQLLTFGAQLRGSRNTVLGQLATAEVRALLKETVRTYIKSETDQVITILNDSKRTTRFHFGSDPDVAVIQDLHGLEQPMLSIEIKGGTDVSNMHNRLGEAEKSHQKAKAGGYTKFWTIIRTEIDERIAKQESPTTSQFFHLDQIKDARTAEHKGFRNQLGSIIGIKT